MIETLLGGLLGDAFRRAPEVLKWLDRKGKRGHELAMQDKALEVEKLRGAQRMVESGRTPFLRSFALSLPTGSWGCTARRRLTPSSVSQAQALVGAKPSCVSGPKQIRRYGLVF
jgi:hypothetical protein